MNEYTKKQTIYRKVFLLLLAISVSLSIFVSQCYAGGANTANNKINSHLPKRQAVEIEEDLVAVKKRIGVLKELVNRRQKEKADTSYAQITLRVAALFEQFARIDAKNVEYNKKCFRKWKFGFRHGLIDKKIIEQQAYELPKYELRKTIEIIDTAISDLTEKFNLEDRPQNQINIDTSKLIIKNGYFYLNNKPYFLNGYNLLVNNAQISDAHSLGANIAGIKLEIRDFYANENHVNNEYGIKVKNKLQYIANELGMIPLLRIKHKFPVWIHNKYSDIGNSQGHFFYYDFDHPAALELYDRFLRSTLAFLEADRVTIYKIGNEPSWPVIGNNTAVFSNYTYDKFIKWLKQKYGSIDNLNNSWGRNFGSFKRIRKIKVDKKNKALWYDFCSFNQERVGDYFEIFYSKIKEYDDNSLVLVNNISENIFKGTLSRKTFLKNKKSKISAHANGIDIQRFAEVMDLHGFDTRALPGPPFHIHHPWYDYKNYSLHWLGLCLAYDFHRSISPDKPIFETELHNIQTIAYHNNDIPADHMVSVLWLMHLHGVASNMLWSWGRDRRGKLINSPDGTQHSNLLTQPQLLNAYARTMLELNSFSELIAAFNSNDAKVKFLYSESSAIQDLNYLDIQQVAYEALYFSGLKTGFITEKMISNNDIIRAELIIIPSVNYVAEKTVRKIQAYYEKGGKLLIVGDNAFQFNGHGENHDEALLEFLKEIPRIKPANSKNLLPILEGYLNDYKINNPVTCSVKDTANSYGIHYRVVQYENKFYLIAINVSNKKLPILIHNNNQEIKAAYNMRKHINEDITALHLFPKEVYFLRF